ncbi:hypothetical protein [uncultured Shewanella sp.]|uniref:hypothetical protein n=1 Tax=uncultured Shewanella sp. TaxID=173975 RepID=UPI002636542C|nr:hypothetical protein [uncultured Shewanella sp.]
MDLLLSCLVVNHLLLAIAIILLSNSPEGLALLPIFIMWLGFELFVILGCFILFLKARYIGKKRLWLVALLTFGLLYGQLVCE